MIADLRCAQAPNVTCSQGLRLLHGGLIICQHEDNLTNCSLRLLHVIAYVAQYVAMH